MLPKLSFPRFDGSNPTIWKDKCVNYFTLCNIPESFWTTTAALHMDDNAAKWVQVYKQEHGLDSWSVFIEAVEQKFEAVDYRDALSVMFDLHQTTKVDEYISAFEDLQYHLTMHNCHLSEMFFCHSVYQRIVAGDQCCCAYSSSRHHAASHYVGQDSVAAH